MVLLSLETVIEEELLYIVQDILPDQMPIFLVKKSCKPIWTWGLGGAKTS
jgi:hypothetical protein